MKLSDLSYREYIALEVFPKFASTMLDRDAAWRAFGAADAFLKQAGKENTKIAGAEKRALGAETKLAVRDEAIFREGFAAGHSFGLFAHTDDEMRCNPHSEGANRAWEKFRDRL